MDIMVEKKSIIKIFPLFICRCSPVNTIDTNNSGHRKGNIDRNMRNDKLLYTDPEHDSAAPFQTTLVSIFLKFNVFLASLKCYIQIM